MDLEAMRERVLQGFFKSNRAKLEKPGLYEMFMGFMHAVNWQEPWIVGALAFYCALLATVVVSRRSWETQLVSFVLICGSVYLAPHLNSLLAANWQLLGFSQNYFDSRGVFISAMYSAPLLFIAFLQMLYAFFSSTSLLIRVKRQQLLQSKARAAAARPSSPGEEPTAVPASSAAGAPIRGSTASSGERKKDR